MSPRHLLARAREFEKTAIRELDEHVADLRKVDALKASAEEARQAASKVRKSDASRLAKAFFDDEATGKPTATSPLDDAAKLAEAIAQEASTMPAVRESERRLRVRSDMSSLSLDVKTHVESVRAQAEAEVRRAIRVFEALVGSLAAEGVIRDACRKQSSPFLAGVSVSLNTAMERDALRYLTSGTSRAVHDLESISEEIEKE